MITSPISRREFLKHAAGSMTLLALAGAAEAKARPPRARIRALTKGPLHHFFGYYGMSPWNRSGKKLICLETTIKGRGPNPGEPAGVCVVDAATGNAERITETRAWNFQQGTMFYWNPLAPETEVLFNDIHEGKPACVKLDVTTGKKTFLPMAIAGVGTTGRYALCLDYGRLNRVRPVVGYVGAKDLFPNNKHPEGDGVYLMDLATGETKLIFSLAEAYRRLEKAHPEIRNRDLFFNHTVFNKSDTRFLVLARTITDKGVLESAMFTANLEGSDLREVIPYGNAVSHFDWRNDREIIATYNVEGIKRHVLFTDGGKDHRVVGEKHLIADGHCVFGPDQNWIATDRDNLPRTSKSLLLLNVATGAYAELREFEMAEMIHTRGEIRCDLHPRWKATGDQVCVDAFDAAGLRQLHIADIEF
jgi:hypothetical protein